MFAVVFVGQVCNSLLRFVREPWLVEDGAVCGRQLWYQKGLLVLLIVVKGTCS